MRTSKWFLIRIYRQTYNRRFLRLRLWRDKCPDRRNLSGKRVRERMWILRGVAMGTDELSGPLCGTCIGGHGPSPLPVYHDGDLFPRLFVFLPHTFFFAGDF
jgi:hypothetical protein